MSSIKSRIESQYDYYHFIVLGLVFLGLAVKFVLVSLLLVLYLVFLFIKKRDTFWFLLIIILIFLAVFSIKEVCYYALPFPSKGVVLEKAQATSTNKYLVQTGLSKVIIYAKEELREGDVISYTGEASTYQIHYLSGFDYQSYLHFQNIRKSIVADSVIKKGHMITPYYLHEAVNRYLENSFQGEARVYLKVFITGTNDELEKEPLNNLGISHLFVISGLHVSLLLGIIKKIAHLLKLSSKTEFIISCLFLGCYLLLTAFLISVIRVVVSFLLKKKMSISGLDLASFNFTSVLLVNPYYLWQTSFILSYAIYLFLSIYESFKITKQPFFNKLINLWVLTCLIQLFTLPITTRFNPDFNILSVLINPFYILLVSYLILPLSIVTCMIPPLAPLYQLVMAIFQKSVENLANIKFLRVSLGNINIYFKLLYYAMFYFFLRSLYTKKYYLWIIIPVLLLLWYGKGWFQLETKIIFLDMPTGDACLITTPHQKEVIVIDTSDVTKNNEMAKILKNEGVRKIDYLILTHHDSDHAGGAKMLVQDLKTKNLISSYYEEEALTEISAYVRKRYFLRRGDCLSKGEIKLEVLSPGKDYGNPNDNSLVFILSVDGVTLLNMGDASTKVEQQLLNDKINVDFYKVGHHGSITSTSTAFLGKINYQYAIIMNGYQNKFGFPSSEVVSRFDERLIVTKDEGSIYFKVYRGKIRHINWRRKLIYG